MDCQAVRKFIQIYLDGEFDDADRHDFEQHLIQCGDCRAQAEYERRFRDALHARLPRPKAPAELVEKVNQIIQDKPTRRITNPLVWGSIPAAAVLASVIMFTWTVTSGFSSLVDEAVARHSKEPPIEVSSTDCQEVEKWFRAKVDFNVALPRFKKPQFALEGGRLSNLAKRQAAYIRYRNGAQRFSLFVISDADSTPPGQRCQRVSQQEFCLSEVRGYSVVSWRSRGLLYSMVGDSTANEILRVLTNGRVD